MLLSCFKKYLLLLTHPYQQFVLYLSQVLGGSYMPEPKCALHPSHVAIGPLLSAGVSQSPGCSTPICSRNKLGKLMGTVWGGDVLPRKALDFTGCRSSKKKAFISLKSRLPSFKWFAKIACYGISIFICAFKNDIKNYGCTPVMV